MGGCCAQFPALGAGNKGVVSVAPNGPLMYARVGGPLGPIIRAAREGGREAPGGILSLTYLGPHNCPLPSSGGINRDALSPASYS